MLRVGWYKTSQPATSGGVAGWLVRFRKAISISNKSLTIHRQTAYYSSTTSSLYAARL